ncbi:LysR family transcriptional regulator [Blastochloris viridis]|uniref:CysJI operon transcriptional activator n=1 Tax=Blastochloris viridis TaxID=1079 RepID=A0A0H5BQG4_BLAVI|nr:LysR family transcriptional regulator [Blastochloris viridis]ALK09229.1 HTH-type transcriptional regulator CysL [Blastochloris viridis]BAS00904.1 LysR family transcriptional regulator YeiE [Blastochloris viridis]CUU41892.1 CysJI operon transcriptional activator [Blastochloris viridis]
MTLDQLRIFVAVAEREHVTRAAGDLALTQSAVSAAVAALEARHATQLFHRVGRGIALTEAGRLFLVEARAVLARAAAAEAMLADLAGLARGHVAVAASQTVANDWLPPRLVAFRTAHPGVTVSLAIGNTAFVASQVGAGIVELGLVEGEVDHPLLAVEAVAEDQLVAVAAPGLAGVPDRALTPDDIRAMRWVARERGSGTRALFEAMVAAAGLTMADLAILLELPSNEAVRAAAAAGGGAAVLSRLAVAGALAAGTLRALDLEPPTRRLLARRFLALRHRERAPSRAGQALMATIRGPD